MAHVAQQVNHSKPSWLSNEILFYKFSPVSRYLQISTMPGIIIQNRGSWEEFVEKFFWAKPIHNFIGHNFPVVMDDIFYI